MLLGLEPGHAILWKWFCSHCGCPIPLLTRNGKIMVIPAGSLDTAPPITPMDHIFWASRAS
ncbi:GFA family protein [Cyanobacteria bacterium FACHB-472]|nr:GFA family protein [Cyanobacteria bacterium FACHB-472]